MPFYKGMKFTEEHRKRLRESHLGQVAWNKGRKGRQKNHSIVGLRPHVKGEFKHSDESKKKMSESSKGQIVTEETKLKLRQVVRRGSDNNLWRDGASRIPYPKEFNEQLKELVRQRDGNVCQECGKINSELSGRLYKLDIHHIDYNKDNLSLNNLITLCRHCHNKTNFDREVWTEYFNLILV